MTESDKISNLMTQQTLWVYGDSFADTLVYSEQSRKRLWPQVTVDLLSVQTSCSWEIQNLAWIGSSLEFSYHQMRTSLGSWKSGDMVVFLATDPSRCWFIQDRPDMSNVFTWDLDEQVKDREKIDAIAAYFRHVHRPELGQLKITTIIESIAYWSLRHPTVSFLVIPCFPMSLIGQTLGSIIEKNQPDPWHYPNLAKTNGNLLYVQQNEFCLDENAPYMAVKNWKGWDLRYNHLTLSNHRILAKKISKFYSDNIPVDLTTGFNRELFSYACLDDIDLIDPVFREKELCPETIEKFLEGSKKTLPTEFIKKIFK